MNPATVFNIIGKILVFVSLFMVVPVGVSLAFDQTDTIQLGISCLITLASGILMHAATRRHSRAELTHREAFAVVTLTWVAMSAFSCLP
ncbi:MAG TPA: TrkH family potassium uptake protein, partial [Dissulfurispiraceae bacterium]|nr:TrkH family potassium uptake protein [Dissulfurispiraceae bacterium]